MRKKISPAIKVKVAIEALKGVKTISEIASEYAIHPTQVSQWKKQFVDNAEELFTTSKPTDEKDQIEKHTEVLYAKIGHLEIELDFLKKKSKQLER